MTEEQGLGEMLDEAAAFVRAALDGREPTVGLVLGSGLNPFAECIEDAVLVPYVDVPHMKKSTANGHVGRFVCGTVEGVCVLAMQGRLHEYEGYAPQDVAFPVWLMGRLGVKTLVTTNAAGAINESYAVGDFCVMADHINFSCGNPLVGAAGQLGMRFVPMTDAYDPALRALALAVAAREGVAAHEGVYLAVSGPSFETPAEIRAFRALGADTVAMSVVEETVAARHMGMRVLGMSLVSNMAAGIGAVGGVGGAAPTDTEVMDVAATREEAFARLMRGILPGIAGIAEA